MRFLKNILIVLSAGLLLAACSRPKTIPDEKLEQIFEEIFLVNSYYNVAGNRSQIDSVDLYRPILQKYGYKVGDLTYTIENYSKRKSVKIADLVEKSIRRLEKGEQRYTALVATRDTINAQAKRQFSQTVYYDTAISVTRFADTAKLRIHIPVQPGEYTISYRYLLDSLDMNGRARSMYELYNPNWYRTGNTMHGLTTRRSSFQTSTMTAEEYDKTLVLKLAGYSPDMKRPHVYIDSIRVVYSLPIQVALDSLTRYNFRKVFTLPEPYAGLAQDNGTRFINPPRLPEGWDDNA